MLNLQQLVNTFYCYCYSLGCMRYVKHAIGIINVKIMFMSLALLLSHTFHALENRPG